MTEVAIGTAIVAYIEPHEGQAHAFNRWYERDHFYAATTAGPGAFAGARWVATRACKAVRPSVRRGSVIRRGSFLTTVWLLDGAQPEWDAWVGEQMEKLRRKPIGCSRGAITCTRRCTASRASGEPTAVLRRDRARPSVRWCDRDRGCHAGGAPAPTRSSAVT